jgi:cysteine-S-conjugate beta-lyase
MSKLPVPSLTELRQRKSEKWREYPLDVLPLPVAEMDFEIAKPIRDRLIEMLESSDTGYLGPIPELGINLAQFARARWAWEIDPEQVFIATDVGVGMVEMARTIVKPGDSIMINSPVYHNMNNWIRELRCEVFDAPLTKNGQKYSIDLAAIERGYAGGVKAHFLCNPHNPVGVIFSRDELASIAEMAKKFGVSVFSDEIHAPLTYAREDFTPFLAVSDIAREVGVCVTAASKSWNLAGLKCATIVTGHLELLTRAKTLPPALHSRASLLGAVAAATAYECVDWLDSAIETLDSNRKFLANELAEKLPSVGYREPDSSYLAWLDLSSLNLGENPAAVLLKEAKLALNSGISFGPESGQFVRLNFATSEEIISEAIDRIVSLVYNRTA